MILFGAAVHEYSIRYSNDTGFHVRDNDPRLRKVEKDILIPKIMRDLSRTEYCVNEVKAFNDCCLQFETGSLKSYMTYKYCKNENEAMMECMNKMFLDLDFYFKCKEIYLQDKKLYEATNVEKKNRKLIKEKIVNGEQLDVGMEEDIKTYFDAVKKAYESSEDINAYDDTLLKS